MAEEVMKDYMCNEPVLGDVLAYSEYKSSRMYVGTVVSFNAGGLPRVNQHGARYCYDRDITTLKTVPSRFIITNIVI